MGRHPVTQPPRVFNIDSFLGMCRDRSGTEMKMQEFRTLYNINNILAQSLQKRYGCLKFGSVADTNGAKVQALMTFLDSASAKTFLKVANKTLYKWTAGAPGSWSAVGSNVFTDTTTFVKQLMTQKTGASADITGTSTASDFTSVTHADTAMTINAHVGKILSINGEKKVIIGNTAQVFQVAERFDVAPPNGTYNVYARQQEVFVATGTEFYKCDLTTLTQLDNSVHATSFTGIELHDNRLWGWKKNRLSWSDVGNGETFSATQWKDFSSDITCAVDLAEIIVVYEPKKVTVKLGDVPDSFVWRTTLSGYGTSAPKSVATFPGYQMFLDDAYGVMLIHLKDITIRALTPYGDEVEPVSISLNYINTLIYAHTAAERSAACAWVKNGNYHLRIGSDVFICHFQASLDSRPIFNSVNWIWSIRSYPAAIVPNVMGEFDTDMVYGGSTNGQVYTIDDPSTFDDDGTAILQRVEKCDYDPTGRSTLNSYDALYLYQDTPAATKTYNLFIATGGTTFNGTPDLTWDPFTASAQVDLTSRLVTLKFPSNYSDAGGKKDSGITTSFKIEETSSTKCTDIENIELHLYPGILS